VEGERDVVVLLLEDDMVRGRGDDELGALVDGERRPCAGRLRRVILVRTPKRAGDEREKKRGREAACGRDPTHRQSVSHMVCQLVRGAIRGTSPPLGR